MSVSLLPRGEVVMPVPDLQIFEEALVLGRSLRLAAVLRPSSPLELPCARRAGRRAQLIGRPRKGVDWGLHSCCSKSGYEILESYRPNHTYNKQTLLFYQPRFNTEDLQLPTHQNRCFMQEFAVSASSPAYSNIGIVLEFLACPYPDRQKTRSCDCEPAEARNE